MVKGINPTLSAATPPATENPTKESKKNKPLPLLLLGAIAVVGAALYYFLRNPSQLSNHITKIDKNDITPPEVIIPASPNITSDSRAKFSIPLNATSPLESAAKQPQFSPLLKKAIPIAQATALPIAGVLAFGHKTFKAQQSLYQGKHPVLATVATLLGSAFILSIPLFAQNTKD